MTLIPSKVEIEIDWRDLIGRSGVSDHDCPITTGTTRTGVRRSVVSRPVASAAPTVAYAGTVSTRESGTAFKRVGQAAVA